MSNAAILVAGGSGQRFSTTGPAKQFRLLKGYPVYFWAAAKFILHKEISHLVITAPADSCKSMAESLQEQAALREQLSEKSLAVIAGGVTRQESVYFALKHLAQFNIDNVFVHDAVRPFLSNSLLDACIEQINSGAFTVGLPVHDTLKKVENGIIIETVDRSWLFSVQTPQGAPMLPLTACHEAAIKDGISVTDDAALLETYGHCVRVLEGEPHNIKLTIQEDFSLCEHLAAIYLPEQPWLNT
jgi:2-C-methyl-D-erythritol 4-phosphate cytidylyltransferase